MQRWRAVQGSEPANQPGMVFMTILAGNTEDFDQEWLAARVIARRAGGHKTYEAESLESGIKALIVILQDKLEALHRERYAA